MFHCTTCDYTSNRRANLQTHYERKNKCQPVIISVPVVVEPVKIKVREPCIEPIEAANPCQCQKCDKILSTKKYAKKHELLCNGLHILQCPTCLKMCKNKSAKSSHIFYGKCKPPINATEAGSLLGTSTRLQEKIARLENTIETLTSTITTLTGTIETLKNKPKPKRGALNGPVRLQIASDQKWHCSSCDIVFVSTFEVDHTIPLWDGGLDHRDNATALCVSCHALKTQNEWVMRSHKREHVSE